jgi:hypothetical protein
MKRTAFILLAVAITAASCSQEIPVSKVPSVVQNTLQAKFPSTTGTEWEKKNNLFEAEFKNNNTEYTAHLDPAGKLIMYKMDIPIADLPAVITAAIGRDHAGYDIDDAEKLDKDGISYYQVELESKGKKDKKLVFSATGEPASHITFME